MNDLAKILKDLMAYNEWANNKLLEACEKLNNAQVNESLGGSFDTILDLLYHIYDAQIIWLKRVNGESLQQFPAHESKSFASISRLLKAHSSELNAWTKAQEPEFLTSHVPYTTTSGESFTQSISQALLQLSHHGNYHRGQLVNYIRRVSNVKAPQTDYILYKRLGH